MNLSSILIVVDRHCLESSLEQLGELSGVTVHHWDAATGRIVVTQEAESINAEIEGLQTIKGLAYVSMAEMAFHYVEESDEVLPCSPRELNA